MRKILISLVTILSLSVMAIAADKADKIETKVSGVIFAEYGYVLSDNLADGKDAAGFNAFDISRIYLTGDAKFNDKVSAIVQLETNLFSKEIWNSTTTANTTYLKQAALKIKDFCPVTKATLWAGFIPVPWRGYEEKIWKHRFVAKLLDDIEDLGKSTDRGIKVTGSTGIVEYDLAMLNGEGTKANETNKYKDYDLRTAIDIPTVEGLKLNLYYQDGNKGQNLPRDRFFGGLSYESKLFNAMATYYQTKDRNDLASAEKKGKGFSLHSVVNLTERHWVFARFDQFDPNKDTADDKKNRVIAGLGCKLTDGVKATLDYQTQLREKETATAKDVAVLFSHLEVKF